ncbi:hypothetical protein ACJX0J_014341, partial [Zea mays]
MAEGTNLSGRGLLEYAKYQIVSTPLEVEALFVAQQLLVLKRNYLWLTSLTHAIFLHIPHFHIVHRQRIDQYRFSWKHIGTIWAMESTAGRSRHLIIFNGVTDLQYHVFNNTIIGVSDSRIR